MERKKHVNKRMLILLALGAIIISGVLFINLENKNDQHETVVIAHRGFMDKGVENSLTAIKEAKKVGAEIVEIDVQQTNDGEFIVFHDKSLSRLANEDDLTYNLSLEELKKTTVIADGYVDRVASLEQVLEVSNDLNIKLLIEMKTHGFETEDFLQRFIKLLNEYNALEVHYVQSPNLPVMAMLEQLEPHIHTGYVFSIVIDQLPESEVDFISMEQSFVSESIQQQIDDQNKKLFVWTINKEEDMQHFYEQNIDGIITDHPDKALALRQEFEEQSHFLRRILNKIENIN